MAGKSVLALKAIEDIQSLRELLKTEMSIGEPEEGKVKAEIKVYNDAPLANGGSEIVFMGVGLVVIDGRERGIRKLNEKIKTSRPSDHVEGRQKYNQGEWFSGTNNERFPAYTSDENSHGQILFPGESVLYEITVSEDTLPYLDIRVEGSVSRRHLFHISRPMLVLKERGLPLVAETFQALDKIDLYSPLLSLPDAIPAFSPKTTLADLDAYRGKIEEAIGHVKQVMPELNKVFHSAPNQELRDLMKQHIGKYLTTSERMCNRVLETLSGSDTGRMKESTEELKAHLLTLDEVKRAKVELMSQFGIDS